MLKIRFCSIVILFLICFAGGSVKFQLGSPGSFLAEVTSRGLNNGSEYSLISAMGENIPVTVEFNYLDKNKFVLRGRVRDSENSRFIFRGDGNQTFGWMVLRNRDVAYEYSTNTRGLVVVEEVPISKVNPKCDFGDREKGGVLQPYYSPLALSGQFEEPHIGPYDGSDLYTLESLPGAQKVIYLDITRIMNDDEPKKIAKEEVWIFWQGISAFYSAFKVNVTTNVDVYDEAGIQNSTIVIFMEHENGSWAEINGFGTTAHAEMQDQPDGHKYARVGGHEIGHLLGLTHDGHPDGAEPAYFEGHPEYKWNVLMGRVISTVEDGVDALIQNSKGEYDGANNNQEDFVQVLRHLEYKEDDYTAVTPLVFGGVAGEVPAELNYGQIGRNTDTDQFSFTIGSAGGNVNLKIDRIEYYIGGMLDVHALIHNDGGDLMAESNPETVRYAEFDLDLPAGNYILTIQGGSEGTPETGFSNYGSLGYYAIEGTVGGQGTRITRHNFESDLHIQNSGGALFLHMPGAPYGVEISLISISGKKVFHSLKPIDTIDVSGFQPGIYFLEFKIRGQLVLRHLLKSF